MLITCVTVVPGYGMSSIAIVSHQPLKAWAPIVHSTFSVSTPHVYLRSLMSATAARAVGTAVGNGDGSSDGIDEGSAVGASDGSGDGSSEGIDVGSRDGSSEGDGDGSSEGCDDGSSEGMDEGSAVGASDGSCVGASVGSGVGIGVGSTDGNGEPVKYVTSPERSPTMQSKPPSFVKSAQNGFVAEANDEYSKNPCDKSFAVASVNK